MLEQHQSPWMDEELSIMRSAVRKFIATEFTPTMPDSSASPIAVAVAVDEVKA